jgi:hypothetical protein
LKKNSKKYSSIAKLKRKRGSYQVEVEEALVTVVTPGHPAFGRCAVAWSLQPFTLPADHPSFREMDVRCHNFCHSFDNAMTMWAIR